MMKTIRRDKTNITRSALLALTDHTQKLLDIEKEREVTSFINTMIREKIPLVMIKPLLQKSDIIYTSKFDEKVLLLTEQIENFALERNALTTNEAKTVSEDEPDSTEPKEGPESLMKKRNTDIDLSEPKEGHESPTNKRKTDIDLSEPKEGPEFPMKKRKTDIDLSESKEGPESPMKKRNTDLDSIFGSDSDDDDPESPMKKRKTDIDLSESKEGPESPMKKRKTDLELYLLSRKGFTVNNNHDDHDDYSTEPKKGVESPIAPPKSSPVNLGEEFANVVLSPQSMDLSPFSQRYMM